MKKKTDIRQKEEFDDFSDESNDYAADSINAPKRSPMRRKEKFRVMDFREKKQRDQKRSYRNKMKYDFDF